MTDASDSPDKKEDLPSLLDIVDAADIADTVDSVRQDAPSAEPNQASDPFAPTPDAIQFSSGLDLSSGDLAPLSFDTAELPPPSSETPDTSVTPDEPQVPTEMLPELPAEPPHAPIELKASEPEIQKIVDAEFPWSVRITGHLRQTERERLIELINEHEMGIREMDLEPQFEAGKILIPRISEYAAVLIVGALRATTAEITAFPSDQTELSARESAPIEMHGSTPTSSTHPAEQIPVTSDHALPSFGAFRVVDTLSASLALATQIVHAKESAVYQNAIDALKRELQYKAFYKGAQGLVNLSIQLIPLSPLTHYRAVVMATAISPTQTPPLENSND